jgi:hypothetical protein
MVFLVLLHLASKDNPYAFAQWCAGVYAVDVFSLY